MEQTKMQTTNQPNRNRGPKTNLYELVPWIVYAVHNKARVAGINYRPITRRGGQGLYYSLQSGHEAVLSDGTRKPLLPDQAYEIVRRLALQQADGPIDHWFASGAPVLPGGSLVTLRSEPDRRAYLIAGPSTASAVAPKPADPALVVAGLPDEQALSALIGVPIITYDLHSACTLVRRLRSAGSDARLYSLPLRSIRDRAHGSSYSYEPEGVTVECQSIILGLVPLGSHWVLPTYPITDAIAKHFGAETLKL
jgi:hypothetical protein